MKVGQSSKGFEKVLPNAMLCTARVTDTMSEQ